MWTQQNNQYNDTKPNMYKNSAECWGLSIYFYDFLKILNSLNT